MDRGQSLMRNRAGAKSIGAMMPGLTKKAFEKYGFPAAALLLDWENIVGAQLASYTQPEKLKWPRVRDVEPDDDIGADISGYRDLSGATLVVRVDGARSIELQHQAPQLIERINAYFGYRAIVELRIIQAPISVMAASVTETSAKREQPKVTPNLTALGIEDIPTDGLRAALSSMAEGIARKQTLLQDA